jgi:hypothetical protein
LDVPFYEIGASSVEQVPLTPRPQAAILWTKPTESIYPQIVKEMDEPARLECYPCYRVAMLDADQERPSLGSWPQ